MLRSPLFMLGLWLTACGDPLTDDVGGGDPGGVDAPEAPPDVVLRRLSVGELDAVLVELLGVTGAPAATLLPADQLSPFDNEVALQEPSAAWVEGVETLATQIAAEVVADPVRLAALVACPADTAAPQPCLDTFLPAFLRRALRREVSEPDVLPFRRLVEDELVGGGDLASATALVLRAVLQDPELNYRAERVDPARAGHLDGATLASRMSFLLWGTMPDAELLDAARDGLLSEPEGRRAQARRMLADPRALTQALRYHAMWLGYTRIVDKPDIIAVIRAEVDAIVERVVFTEKRPWKEIFTLPELWVGPDAAGQYDLPEPRPTEHQWMDLTAQGRGGVLSTIAFLSATSHTVDTSPTLRGKAVLSRVLCQAPAPPPPGASADTPPSPEIAACRLDRYATHRTNPSCAGCHASMDAIGTGLERWDRSGAFREHDYFLYTLDENPDCPLPVGADVPGLGHFESPYELGQLVAGSAQVEACMIGQVASYAFGGLTSVNVDALTASLLSQSTTTGGRYDLLLTELVASGAFAAVEAP